MQREERAGHMRSVWKGLVVGGLAGVVAGAVLDTIARGSKKALAVGDQVREHAPDAGRWLQSVTDKAGEWIHDADLPEHVQRLAERVRESGPSNQVKQTGKGVLSTTKDALAAHHG
jgi:hypothetical protein